MSDRAILGARKCPSCGQKFKRLTSSAKPINRTCDCGKRWTLSFEPVEPEFAARLGMEADRIIVKPYVDGRKRQSVLDGANNDEGQLSFSLEIDVMHRPPPRPKKRSR